MASESIANSIIEEDYRQKENRRESHGIKNETNKTDGKKNAKNYKKKLIMKKRIMGKKRQRPVDKWQRYIRKKRVNSCEPL